MDLSLRQDFDDYRKEMLKRQWIDDNSDGIAMNFDDTVYNIPTKSKNKIYGNMISNLTSLALEDKFDNVLFAELWSFGFESMKVDVIAHTNSVNSIIISKRFRSYATGISLWRKTANGKRFCQVNSVDPIFGLKIIDKLNKFADGKCFENFSLEPVPSISFATSSTVNIAALKQISL